jgi:pimeloyl-ACP methyl ester carboxylesterase
MPYSSLESSPLLPGVNPVEIYYRENGQGRPLLFLHSGWGYDLYPFTRQIETFGDRYRIISADRSGYGRSTHLVADLPTDFHYRAATETLSLMDSLTIDRASFWGHSDGAVIAAIIGFTAPQRVDCLIMEAFHYTAVKPRSREFFETLAQQPETLGTELCDRFASEHGAAHWRHLITSHARAWLQMAVESKRPTNDLFGDRLSEIAAPTLFIHGLLDPRTEPGELDAVRRQLPHAEMQILAGGSHSPHSERATADQVTRRAAQFFESFLG